MKNSYEHLIFITAAALASCLAFVSRARVRTRKAAAFVVLASLTEAPRCRYYRVSWSSFNPESRSRGGPTLAYKPQRDDSGSTSSCSSCRRGGKEPVCTLRLVRLKLTLFNGPYVNAAAVLT